MYKRIFELFELSTLGDYPLEKEIGLAQGSIRNWKTNKSNPSTEAIIKIAKYFKVSTDYILEISNNPFNEKMSIDELPTDIQEFEQMTKSNGLAKKISQLPQEKQNKLFTLIDKAIELAEK